MEIRFTKSQAIIRHFTFRYNLFFLVCLILSLQVDVAEFDYKRGIIRLMFFHIYIAE